MKIESTKAALQKQVTRLVKELGSLVKRRDARIQSVKDEYGAQISAVTAMIQTLEGAIEEMSMADAPRADAKATVQS